jgi:8-oxo-dGTP pyrophosphatase MutT (NUDIX family)
MADELIYETRYFAIRSRDGIDYIRGGDEMLVVALDGEGSVLLIVEPSAAFDQPVLVLAGGEVEPDEPRNLTANRELQEEIGLKAGRLDFLGELLPWSKYLEARSFVYLGRDLTESRLQGDEGYDIIVERVPLDSFESWIASGRLRDSRVIAALYLARAFVGAGK